MASGVVFFNLVFDFARRPCAVRRNSRVYEGRIVNDARRAGNFRVKGRPDLDRQNELVQDQEHSSTTTSSSCSLDASYVLTLKRSQIWQPSPATRRHTDERCRLDRPPVWHRCLLRLLARTGPANLVLAATIGLRRECVGKLRMAVNEGLTGLVAEQVRPVAVERVKNHPRFKFFSELGEEPCQSFLGVPLIDRGVLQGVLVVQTIEPRIFPKTRFVY